MVRPKKFPTSGNLTKKQSEALDAIREYLAAHKYSPSYRDVMRAMGIKSPATAYSHVQALRKKGYLRLRTGKMRSAILTEKADAFTRGIELPLAGIIAAGRPIEALQEEQKVSVPIELLPNLNCYVLQVKGDSMKDDGILDGDYVIVERNFYPSNGDVVVALLENENATLKRYYRERTRIRLQPANKRMKPIYVKNPVVQGIVRAVMRRY
ncbi:MAG TPA: transcriptional repressor LexA [Candidatus Andersenbacteria bacterium]|nr:transcriptional repressor LexA [Candidatus Andersenbacteria bacterium]